MVMTKSKKAEAEARELDNAVRAYVRALKSKQAPWIASTQQELINILTAQGRDSDAITAMLTELKSEVENKTKTTPASEEVRRVRDALAGIAADIRDPGRHAGSVEAKLTVTGGRSPNLLDRPSPAMTAASQARVLTTKSYQAEADNYQRTMVLRQEEKATDTQVAAARRALDEAIWAANQTLDYTARLKIIQGLEAEVDMPSVETLQRLGLRKPAVTVTGTKVREISVKPIGMQSPEFRAIMASVSTNRTGIDAIGSESKLPFIMYKDPDFGRAVRHYQAHAAICADDEQQAMRDALRLRLLTLGVSPKTIEQHMQQIEASIQPAHRAFVPMGR